MIEMRKHEEARRDEYTLIERLVDRQGLSREEAMQAVVNLRRGKRVEIDPALMEGLDAI